MNEFDGFARYYDADFGYFEDDVPFYRELARSSGGPILEAMCGTGRVLLPLAQAGYRVTGLDISPALLEVAREKIQEEGLSGQAELIEADICLDAPQGPYGMAFIALNSFMHLTNTRSQLAALQRIHGALRPDGILALDLFNPDLRAIANYNNNMVFDKTMTLDDGTQVYKFVTQDADPANQILSVQFFYDELGKDGIVRRNVRPFELRWLYRYELEHLLARAGFKLEAVYGNYDLDEYSAGSDLMLTVARKIT